MTIRLRLFSTLSVLAFAAAPTGAAAETPLTTIRIAQGLSLPLYVTSPPGDTGRVFIVEQRGGDARGRIKIFKNGTVLATPFLTTPVLTTGSEQGLLGLAFAPDYGTSGRFYINYTRAGDGKTMIVRHTVSGNPDIADPAGVAIDSIPQPFTNHNGGWMGFGPDGYLYVSSGDGGDAGDPGDRAQNLNTKLGKILRIDVSGSAYTSPPSNPFFGPTPGLDEIWAFGLRNPWRCSFDRKTGDFAIADVGQGIFEEVNLQPASSAGGENYGWRCYEADSFYAESDSTPCDSCLAPACPKVFPNHDYDHSGGRCSVTGGYVYRGCAIPDLDGEYFFADYCTAKIYSGRFSGGSFAGLRDRTLELAPAVGSIGLITSFGEDGKGELYICDRGGEVYKVVPAAPVADDDMPVLDVSTGFGSLGSTTPGNALLPGVTAFADAGSRIVGAGYIADATLRDCTTVLGDCLTSHMRLGTFDIDLEACVDGVASTLTRRFVLTNRGAGPQNLSFVDVVTSLLDGNEDGAKLIAPGTATKSATLALYDSFQPDLYVQHWGTGSIGTMFSADIDTASQLEARVGADQPLAGGSSAGPAALGLALRFDFGSVAAAVAETVTVFTSLQSNPPTGIDEEAPPASARVLSVRPVPFESDLEIVLRLAREGPVTVEVYDVRGRRVREIGKGVMPAGDHLLVWDGRTDRGGRASAGIYFVRYWGDGVEESRRVVRLR